MQQAMSQGRTIIIPSSLPVEEQEPFVAMVIPILLFLTPDDATALVVDTVGLGNVRYLSAPEDSDNGHTYGIDLVSADGFVVSSSTGDDALGTVTEHYPLIRGFMEQGEAGAAIH